MDTLPITVPPVLNLVSAIAVGALIGTERERRKGEGPTRSPAGLRTFAIASTAGAVAFSLGGVVLLAVVAASVAGLAAVSYGKRPHQDPGADHGNRAAADGAARRALHPRAADGGGDCRHGDGAAASQGLAARLGHHADLKG
ncbi:MgtC/SapB family protein [Rhodobacter capsulatus]|uniref:MgtC/SapB family protein n=1 Tax=Rhodobacter capsulatus TaxID=1061 RepID=UPI0040292ECE